MVLSQTVSQEKREMKKKRKKTCLERLYLVSMRKKLSGETLSISFKEKEPTLNRRHLSWFYFLYPFAFNNSV